MDWFSVFLTVLGMGYNYSADKKSESLSKEDANKRAGVSKGQAAFAADQISRDTTKLMSGQRAATAKSGVTQEGSPELIARVTREQAEREAMAVLWGGQVGADTAFFEGRIASNTRRQSNINTLLTGARGINNARIR